MIKRTLFTLLLVLTLVMQIIASGETGETLKAGKTSLRYLALVQDPMLAPEDISDGEKAILAVFSMSRESADNKEELKNVFDSASLVDGDSHSYAAKYAVITNGDGTQSVRFGPVSIVSANAMSDVDFALGFSVPENTDLSSCVLSVNDWREPLGDAARVRLEEDQKADDAEAEAEEDEEDTEDPDETEPDVTDDSEEYDETDEEEPDGEEVFDEEYDDEYDDEEYDDAEYDDTEYEEVEIPDSGLLSGEDKGTRVDIIAPNDDLMRFVSLESVDEDRLLTMFVDSGDTISVHAPEGTYLIYVACGTDWLGSDDLFGEEGDYSVSPLVKIRSAEYHHSITLAAADSDNGIMVPVEYEDFPR